MNDIYGIKEWLLWFPFEYINALIYILFILIIIFISKYFFSNTKVEKDIVIKKVAKKEKIDFSKLINEIEKKYINEKWDVFYSHISEVIRLILEEKESKNISKMTFAEINKLNINDEIKNLIKNVYYKEYAREVIDSFETRTDLIEKVKGLI